MKPVLFCRVLASTAILVALATIAPTGGASAYTFKTLHSFCAEANCTDGQSPEGPLAMDAAGNIYGTTFQGGYNARPRVSPDGKQLAILTLDNGSYRIGIQDLAMFSRISYGGGAAAATAMQAAMAVATGVADVVVCYRAMNERELGSTLCMRG